MHAVLLYEYGDAEKLCYTTTDIPKYAGNEVLVSVKATSVNPIDYKLRSGAARARFPLEFPAILGRDLAGEVVEVGSDVAGVARGMRVMALTNRTYAEYAAVKADVLASIPDGLEYEQAGALPLVLSTGSQLIEQAIKLKAGEMVLVTGALGGVARTAVHVARKLGARVLAGVRSSQKNQAAELHADEVIAIDDEGEIDRLHNLDAIADTVGGPTIQRLLKAIKSGGVLGSVLGVPEGAGNYGIRVEAMMTVPDAARLHELAGDFARHEFTIPIARVMKLKDIQEAHRLAESGVGGKIVLVP